MIEGILIGLAVLAVIAVTVLKKRKKDNIWLLLDLFGESTAKQTDAKGERKNFSIAPLDRDWETY